MAQADIRSTRIVARAHHRAIMAFRVCLLISCMLQVLFLTGCQMDVVGDKSNEPSARGWPSWVPPTVQTLQPIVINVGPKPTPQPTPAPPPMVVGTLTDAVGSAVEAITPKFGGWR